jgi:DNA modification methylase
MTESPSTVHGRLLESMHISGYSAARVCDELEWLLDRNRWKECGSGFTDINKFLATIDLSEFRVAIERRKKLAKRLTQLEASQRATAKLIGVTHTTIQRDTGTDVPKPKKKANNIKVSDDGSGTDMPPPAWFQNGKVDPAALAKQKANKDQSIAESRERRAESRAAQPLLNGMDLRIGDCRKVLADVPDASAALILTDPPYEESSETLYLWLAEFAARTLIPGGSLICYTGHYRLQRELEIFDKHLRYWWLLAMLNDQQRRLPGKFVIVGFKPVLWYVKEKRSSQTMVTDVLRPRTAADKLEHPWGQGEGGVTDLIENLTAPGDLIIDPFAGTADWGRIACGMGRRWIGSDIREGGSVEILA